MIAAAKAMAWALTLSISTVVVGQTFPNKPVRVVTSEVGGGNDIVARLIAAGLSGALGQQVIVDNRPGGVIPADTVAKAAPDGHSLLLYSTAMWILPFMQDKVPYDPVRDFSPISLLAIAPSVIVVHPSLPVKSVKELIDLAKARPGELNFSSSAPSASTNLAAQLFKTMAGVAMVGINYKGAGPAVNGLISGEVQLMFATVPSARPHINSGRLKPLAVTSAQPSKLLPDLPTVAGSGLPGYQSATSYGLFAPAKTPESLVKRLNQETVRVLNQPDIKEKLFNTGVDVVGSSQEQFADLIKSEMLKMGKIIKEAGIRTD